MLKTAQQISFSDICVKSIFTNGENVSVIAGVFKVDCVSTFYWQTYRIPRRHAVARRASRHPSSRHKLAEKVQFFTLYFASEFISYRYYVCVVFYVDQIPNL